MEQLKEPAKAYVDYEPYEAVHDMGRLLSGLKKLKYDKKHEHKLVMYENTRTDLKTLLAEGEEASLQYLYPEEGYEVVVDTYKMSSSDCVSKIIEKRPVPTPQGEYTLYCASVTATWPDHRNALVCFSMGILAAVAVLTLLIAGSYYKVHKKQQAIEAAYSQKVNNLAHNLKTPMMVISGYSENFLAEIQTEKKAHYAEKILENVNKMNAIVEEMLEFTGALNSKHEKYDISNIK